MPLSIYIYTFLKLLPRKQATDDFGVVPAEDLHFAHRIVAEIGEAQKVDCQKLTVGRLAHLSTHIANRSGAHCHAAVELTVDFVGIAVEQYTKTFAVDGLILKGLCLHTATCRGVCGLFTKSE